MPSRLPGPLGARNSRRDERAMHSLGKHGLERSKNDRVREGLEFVYGQLPERTGMSREDVKKALREEAFE